MRNLTAIGFVLSMLLACFSAKGQLDCGPLGKAAFVRSNVGHPWDDFGVNTFANLNTMDQIWGANVWSDLRYETLNFPSLLQDHQFIYLEGGDDNAIEMQAFLNQHLPEIEAWVFAGGRLLVNAAPNEGSNIYCGFGGVEIIYDGGGTLNYDAIPMDMAHPVFTGITSNYFDGNYMGHSLICPPGMIGILRAADSPSEVLLAEMDWGDGKVLFGGLTLPWYEMNDGNWGPQPDLTTFGFQVIQYSATGELDCPPDCLGIAGGDAYIDDCGECVGGLTGLNPCILGCIDPTACNYNPIATDDDGSCEFIIDCAGECGGNSIYDDCGTCYDPDGEGITTEEFYYTGQFQTFTVPEGVDSLIVELFGAQGGKSTGCGGIVDFQDDGGYGGYVTGVMLVNPGEVYYLYVGGQGGINGSPGWNGGGIGGTYGGGGGGASDIRTSVGVYASRLVVAGGGGGGQYGCGADYGVGGPGGGLIGGNGIANVIGNPGFGGTQVSGGVGGTSPSSPGSFGTGGSTIQPGVAAGGGGWYGGGSAYQAGGGGGSSYLGSLGDASTTSGIQPGNGLIRIQYEVEIPICVYDCNGELNGTAYLDECGVCVGGATGLEPCILGCTDPSACNYDEQATDDDGSCAFVFDCNGVCGGTFILNECGDCYDPSQGEPDCVLGCDGNYYTNPELAPQFDCAGICGGNAVVDDCGVCGGDNSSCTDCAGVVNGNNILDACGNCYDPALIPIDSTIFDFTGAVQIFNVPSGVSTLYIEAYGAQGANAKDCANVVQVDGGLGGFASGELSVVGGETLYIYVGGAGVSGGSGGWNGGGAGGTYAGGGGGASDVRGIIGNLNSRMIVAGGGGAGSTGCPDAGAGGSGGGLSGDAGVSFVGNIGGGGGTQIAGGAAGSTPSAPGSFGLGGGVFGTYVAGGGGGWYGGGSAYQAGGGGGSSYIGDLQNVVTIPGYNSGNGQVKVYYQIFPECALGCTDPNAINYNPQATDDDGSCLFVGCTDPEAMNYNPDAIEDDGSCMYGGCTNPDAENYDPLATIDDGSCIINGCTDPTAENYNADATVDDGTCEYSGCTDPAAENYNPLATIDDGSCLYSGCTNPAADNYNPLATIDDGSCIINGCTDPEAENYNADANSDDGSCEYLGCTNPAADNYDPSANVDDGSCIVSGCTAEFASNYNPDATIDDGTCECTSDEIRPGCMDPQALNFQIYANQEDGSCVYDAEPSELCGPNTYWDEALQMCIGIDDCPADLNNDLLINSGDLLIFLSYYGLNCQLLGE